MKVVFSSRKFLLIEILRVFQTRSPPFSAYSLVYIYIYVDGRESFHALVIKIRESITSVLELFALSLDDAFMETAVWI